MRETPVPGRVTVVEQNVPHKHWGEREERRFPRPSDFPKTGDNFRTPPRSELFLALGIMERALDMPERAEADFTLHADWQNYLSGRGRKDG